MMVFCPEDPKWDQNLKFTPLSETTSIPTPFICGVPPPPSAGSQLPDALSPKRNKNYYVAVGSIWVSGILLTFLSRKPTVCPKWEVSVNVGLREGRWAVSQKPKFIPVFYHNSGILVKSSDTIENYKQGTGMIKVLLGLKATLIYSVTFMSEITKMILIILWP